MTKGHQYRGFFDPISLGIYLKFPLSEYKNKDLFIDTEKLDAFGSFAHEFTHYLQFYGTTFGIYYILNLLDITEITKKLIVELEKKHSNLKTPIISYIPDIDTASKIVKIEKSRLTEILFKNRFFNEEFFGLTYTLIETNPIFINNRPIISSPVFLPLNDKNSETRYLPITGKVIFESHACFNETAFIARASPDNEDYYDIVNRNYSNLEPSLRDEYMGLRQWISKLGLIDIEPLLFFIILNQTPEHYYTKPSEYQLASSLKKILLHSPNLAKLKKPKNEDELSSVIDSICTCTKLDNPFVSIERTKNAFQNAFDKYPDDNYYTLERILLMILTWQLENKYYSVYWFENPSVIWNSIPILNLTTSDNFYGYKVSIFPTNDESELKKAINFSNSLISGLLEMYLINNLFNDELCRCPYYFITKPSICNSCNSCSGYFPNKDIKDDCPVIRKWKQIGFSKFPT
jgi:hypothetical protein